MSTFLATSHSELMGGADLLRYFGGVPEHGLDTERFLRFAYPKPEGVPAPVLELRVHCSDGCWRSGRYDDFAIMARHALGLEEKFGAKAIYYGLNPLLPDADHVGCKEVNRFKSMKQYSKGAGNSDVSHRALYLIDIDPVRPKDVMATREEHEQAWSIAFGVRQYLSSVGWPMPITIDSGSGYHLLYRGDCCPATSPHWEHTLKSLADMFDTDGAKIDQGVHNAARISRLPGCWNRKGIETEDRRHRMAFVFEYPSEWEALTAARVIQFATDNGFEQNQEYESSPELLIDDDGVHQLIREFPDQLRLRRTEQRADGTYYILDLCPFVGYRHSRDTGTETAIILSPGRIGFKCFSDTCDKHKFGDLRRLLHEKTGRWPTVNIWSPTLTDKELKASWVDYLWHDIPAAENLATTASETPGDVPVEEASPSPEPGKVRSQPPTVPPAPTPPFWLATLDQSYDEDTRAVVMDMDIKRYPTDPAAWHMTKEMVLDAFRRKARDVVARTPDGSKRDEWLRRLAIPDDQADILAMAKELGPHRLFVYVRWLNYMQASSNTKAGS